MSIARGAVNRPVIVWMRIAALVLLGIICFTKLPVDLLPKISFPTVNVMTQWPNVSPEEIEAQVTRPIEEALSSVQGLYQINSTTVEGVSNVRVQFNWGTDIGQAAVDVLQLVQRAKRNFPSDPTLVEPSITKFDPSMIPVLVLGVSGIKDPVQLYTVLENQVSPIVESVNGVAAATVTGGLPRAILVNLDPVKINAYHISPSTVISRIVAENINAPAGVAKQSQTEYTIRALGWITSCDELRQLPLTAPNGQVVTVGDVAEVKDAYQEQRIFTRLNGNTAVGLTITQQTDANTIDTVKGVLAKLETVKKQYPELQFKIAYDQSQYVQNSVDDLKRNVWIGGILAVMILLFFLRNIRSTLVVALSIPTSIISTFALLYLCGFTLNTMSLSGMALATGLIVDDAVVVLENIFRHIERDKRTAIEAAVEGTDEILSAVFASTWTVMVVFLPLLLIKGQAGQMFSQFALVVIFSLSISLLDAATVVPMLATKLISGEAHAELMENGHRSESAIVRMFNRFGEWFSALDASYRNGLHWALGHRGLTLACALGITVLTFALLPQVGTELMPVTDTGDLSVSVKLPPGTALSKTNAVMQRVETIVRQNPNVDVVFATIGGSGGGGGSPTPISNQASAAVRLKKDRKKKSADVIMDLRKQLSVIPGVRLAITQRDIVSMMMTGGDQSVEIDIFGNDLATLSALSRDVMQRIRGVAGLENVDVNWQESMPEIRWQVDRPKATQLGISYQNVADTLNTATNGTIASYYQDQGFQYPIVVQMPQDQRKTVDEMGNLAIVPSSGNSAGQFITLSQVARPIYSLGPSQITRQNRQRFIAISGAPQGRSSGDVQKDIAKAMAGIQLPAGYYWDWGTGQKRQAEEFAGMGLAVFLAIALIYMLLASQFDSFSHPWAILCSVPLAATGVILGLFLSGRSLGLTALIGMLMLVGIVVKNGILLVDYTNTLRKRGVERNEAVLTASPTRLRPILMTASAAILGMLPIAMGIGRGSEIQAPMATAVIGGLMTSTFLTLFVVPIVYTLLDDLTNRHGRKGDQEAQADRPLEAISE